MQQIRWTLLTICLTAILSEGADHSLTPVTMHATPAGEPIVLVKDSQVMASIVIPANDAGAATAAQEFAGYVRQATGAELLVLTDNQSPITGNQILIGESSLTRALGLSSAGLAPEGFLVQTFSNGLAILDVDADSEWGGVKYFGVYDVLERFLGVRWFYPGPDGTVVPPTNCLVIPPISYSDQPTFTKRSMYPMDAPGFSHEECMALARHWRLGGTAPNMQCSAFGFLAHYYDTHPEIFELGPDGSRNKMMPCFGNPTTLELTLKDIEGLWDRNETKPFETGTGNKQPWTDHRAIHIQPWDADLACNCADCKRIMAEGPDAPDGKFSRVMAQFVSRLAVEIQKRWPDKKVFYQPYMNYTAPPMDVEFPSTNVWVQVCMMLGPAMPKEPAVMAMHDAWVDGWYKLSGKPVQLWEYELWANIHGMPCQFPHILQSFYKKHHGKLVGSFLNGEDAASGLTGEQYAQFGPTMYVWFKLLWNPDYDVDAGIHDYITQLYGPAAGPMTKVIQRLTDRWEKVLWQEGSLHVTCLNRPKKSQIFEESMPPSEIVALTADLSLARKAVPINSVYERRVNLLGAAIDRFAQLAAQYHSESNRPPFNPIKVINQSEYVPGKFGNAFNFNSVSEIGILRSGFRDAMGTVECWVMGGTNGNTGGEIFNATGPNGESGHSIKMVKGHWTYLTWTESRTNTVQAERLSAGWHHLMAVWDGKAGTMAFFVDGRRMGVASYQTTSVNNSPITLGGSAAYVTDSRMPSPWSWGPIDEVRLSTIVRSPIPGGPTAPFIPDADTTLILHFDESGSERPLLDGGKAGNGNSALKTK